MQLAACFIHAHFMTSAELGCYARVLNKTLKNSGLSEPMTFPDDILREGTYDDGRKENKHGHQQQKHQKKKSFRNENSDTPTEDETKTTRKKKQQ